MTLAKLLLIPAAFSASASAHAANIFEQLTPAPNSYSLGADFNTASFGPGMFDISGNVFAVINSNGLSLSLGCDATDFSGYVAGSIALLSRGTCEFNQKAELAQAAGAIGLLVANNAPGGAPGMGGANPAIIIPSYSTSQSLGAALFALSSANLTVRMAAGDVSPTAGVPEPASWAMMISGLTLVGAVIRSRKLVFTPI
jgi:hypothetical protein